MKILPSMFALAIFCFIAGHLWVNDSSVDASAWIMIPAACLIGFVFATVTGWADEL